MCLMVWLGSKRPLPTIMLSSTPDVGVEYFAPIAEPDDAPVRAQFSHPHVYQIGSHEGCGCGFRSQGSAFTGYELVSEVVALQGALLDDEREEFLAEQRSRERLRDVVVTALHDGEVEVFACWNGDEAIAAESVEEVAADHFVTHLDPLYEGTKYVAR